MVDNVYIMYTTVHHMYHQYCERCQNEFLSALLLNILMLQTLLRPISHCIYKQVP